MEELLGTFKVMITT